MKNVIPLVILLAATQTACNGSNADANLETASTSVADSAVKSVVNKTITKKIVVKKEVTKQQITSDVTYLASDELAGRGMFTPEITLAAEFIAKRFKEAGLVPLEGQSGYEQAFSIYNLKPKSVDILINGDVIDKKNIAVASSDETLLWTGIDNVHVTVINAADDFRTKLGELNQAGGNNLVLINSAHTSLFARYQDYFAGGLNKFEINTHHSLVMVVTDKTEVTSLNVNVLNEMKQQLLANVVGVLPGKSKEVVLFSAHYDHLGVDEQLDGDKIFNGADDDASGTTAVMNLAQYFNDNQDSSGNERTLIFSAFTAEEIGGYGSQYFSNHIDSDNIVAMINIEMIGKPSKFGAGKFWMTGFERSNLGTLMNESLKDNNTEIYPDPYPKQRLFYRSDNATLARLGVPAHSFSSTQLDKDEHYHRTSDDVASLDLDSMTQVIKSLAAGAQGLVDGKITPTRVDTSKVNKKGLIF